MSRWLVRVDKCGSYALTTGWTARRLPTTEAEIRVRDGNGTTLSAATATHIVEEDDHGTFL